MTDPSFDDEFDQELLTAAGAPTYFGRDVLRGLVDGIRTHRESQRRSERLWGIGVIGCAMALNDTELLEELARCESSCVVVTKQEKRHYGKENFQRLEKHAKDAQGLANAVFPELEELAPLENGEPVELGPYGPRLETSVPAVRELGFRKVGNRLVPIVHAKLALVGDLCWTDEHPSGYPVDTFYFRPRKLWMGSANFTESSRRSLEVGTWATDEEILTAARQFLLNLVVRSEPLRNEADSMEPELHPVVFDEAAMLEASRDADDLVDDEPWD
ncbi:MAG: hypothetical protein ACRDS9_16475 [Pseudonocardiaceae bacterium]